MKFPVYDTKNEIELVKFWEESKVLAKLNERNAKGENFYFLQGPPYTSGRIHCGQAWNHALKDMVLRYKRMNGFNVLARVGYDMHGLPTAHKVQAKLGLEEKEDIEKFGKDKFVKECIEWSEEKAEIMSNDLINMGITLDFSDPYYPISNDYIDSIWFLMKKADEKERLYLGEKTISWCASCGTALAKHEQEYSEVKDQSIFLKFKKQGTENEYFIIWTTTPWTIPFNLAIMVNPEMDYVKAKVNHKGNEEFWYVCKDLAGIFLSNVDDLEYSIEDEFKGETLEGMKYEHPWSKDNPDIAEINSDKLFTVLLSKEYVDSSAGTGLVHCAPGCGPEDYEVGVRNGIPPYNAIDEKGAFPKRIAKYKSLTAKKDDKEFIKMMKADGFLIKQSPIEHDYAHCERCHNPVVFRTTEQWFFKTEDLKEKMLELNKKVNWHPEKAKNAFNSWLDNLRDNSITKQRIWGTPAPIWVHRNDEGEFDEHLVVGSIEEMEKLSGTKIENPHKPWIDAVKIKSPKTGNDLERIPDILDVWIDAGCASWASLYYPKTEEEFKKYFPADYIVEGKDQIRGWFNLLMVASILAFDDISFKNVGMHGFISDVDGVKMSKSLGNIISPQEVIDKTSVDNFRYYFCGTKAGEDIAFSWEQLSLHQRHLTILWNTAKYFQDLVSNSEMELKDVLEKGKDMIEVEEKYVLSKVNSVLKDVTEKMDEYKLDEVPSVIGNLFLSISRDYIKATRDKSSSEKAPAVIYTLYESLTKVLKMFAPVAPFITEMIYQNFKELGTEDYILGSIHEQEWPKFDENLIDVGIETSFEQSMMVVSGILAAREKAQLNVRQPVVKAVFIGNVDLVEDMVLSQANVKAIDVVDDFDKLSYEVKPNYKELGKEFGQETADVANAINSLGKDEAKLMKETFDEGKTYDLNGKEIKAHFVEFDISVEEPYKLAETPLGLAAIDITLSEELINEGLSRELIRRVQNERKDSGLVKSDKVNLKIDSQEFFNKILPFIDNVKSVCGIDKLEVGKGTVELDIKGNKFKIGIEKL